MLPSVDMRTAAVLGCAAWIALLACSGPGPRSALTDDDRRSLEVLGYLDQVEEETEPDRRGVTHHDSTRSSPGITVLGSRMGLREAYLYGMDGAPLGTWRVPSDHGRKLLWAQPAVDGHLIVVGYDYLLKTTVEGEVLWEAEPARYHHGFDEDDSGRIFAMVACEREVVRRDRTFRIQDDRIVVLSPGGETLKSISVLDLVGLNRIPLEELTAVPEKEPALRQRLDELGVDHPGDVLHLNSLQVVDREVGFAREGDLLTCLRNLDLVLVIDPEEERIVWEWIGGREILDRPHRPVLLETGHIVLLDNGWRRGASRVLEVDPLTSDLVWQYPERPDESFYTRRGGMAQPLPNGNLLITESDRGHVFEVTRSGDVVWDFWNPRFHDGRRETVYRAWRWSMDDLRDLRVPDRLRSAVVPPRGPRDGSELDRLSDALSSVVFVDGFGSAGTSRWSHSRGSPPL